jgi:hypothetical protein
MNPTAIIKQIVQSQEAVIGPLAVDQARRVAGLRFESNGEAILTRNSKDVLNDLVKQYERLFGKASVEVCKDAVKEMKPHPNPEDLPDILK